MKTAHCILNNATCTLNTLYTTLNMCATCFTLYTTFCTVHTTYYIPGWYRWCFPDRSVGDPLDPTVEQSTLSQDGGHVTRVRQHVGGNRLKQVNT